MGVDGAADPDEPDKLPSVPPDPMELVVGASDSGRFGMWGSGRLCNRASLCSVKIFEVCRPSLGTLDLFLVVLPECVPTEAVLSLVFWAPMILAHHTKIGWISLGPHAPLHHFYFIHSTLALNKNYSHLTARYIYFIID
uniref:Uncharacterized protein n=1 Tax=Photinus pyralis TaxID=7054 RepID=A0A1Y1KK37_PHOPY